MLQALYLYTHNKYYYLVTCLSRKIFDVSEANRKTIEQFIDHRRTLRKTEATLQCERSILRKLGDFLGKAKYQDATQKDLERFFREEVSTKSYNPTGVIQLIFYKWLFKLDDEKPQNLKWLKFLTREQLEKNG
jgi:hypothetical protein